MQRKLSQGLILKIILAFFLLDAGIFYVVWSFHSAPSKSASLETEVDPFEANARALASNSVSSEVHQFAVDLEVTPEGLREEKTWSFWRWLQSVFAETIGGCDVESNAIALKDVECLEKRRISLNNSGREIKGDAELFYRAISAIKASNKEALPAWKTAGEMLSKPRDQWWRDQRYFYRYLAHLLSPGAIGPRVLTSPADYLKTISVAAIQSGVAKPDLFSRQLKVSISAAPSSNIALSRSVTRRTIEFEGESVGFLLENRGAALAFAFGRQGLDYAKIPDLTFQGKKVIADFPGPMHSDGARLIELAVRGGRVVNFLMGGGGRRSGLVVLTQDGRAFPFHVQEIDPAVWGSLANVGKLDLSRSYADLISFLTIAKNEKLSVFMEMLLAEERTTASGTELGMTPIKNFASARGRRLLVWKKQSDSTPSLLVVDDGYSINHAVWIAHALGYHWAINLDCDFIDGARYFLPDKTEPQGVSTTFFGRSLDRGTNPYSRLMFFDEHY